MLVGNQPSGNYGIRFSLDVHASIRFIGGCDGQADTPDPIPNSEVKRPGGENTLAGKIAAAAFFVQFFYLFKYLFLQSAAFFHISAFLSRWDWLFLFL